MDDLASRVARLTEDFSTKMLHRYKGIHVFCDASEQAYGSAAHLVTEGPDQIIEVTFLAARSQVAP